MKEKSLKPEVQDAQQVANVLSTLPKDALIAIRAYQSGYKDCMTMMRSQQQSKNAEA